MKITRIMGLLLAILLLSGCEKDEEGQLGMRIYGDAYEDEAYSLSVLNGDLVIAGLRTVLTRRDGNYIESSDRNMGLIRTDRSGFRKWEVTPGGPNPDLACKAIVLPTNHIVAAGYTTRGEGATSHTDIYIVKTDEEGTVVWESVIGGSGNQTAWDLLQKPGGGFMIAGVTDAYRAESGSFTENIAGMQDFFLLEINETGDSIASYAFGYSGNDICRVIRRDIGGGYIMYGTSDNSTEPGLGNNNLLLIRLNEDASNRGAAIIGDMTDEYAADFEVLSNGYLLAATVGKDNEANTIELIKLNTNIQSPPVFTRKINVNGQSSSVNALCRGPQGLFYLGGRTGSASSSDMLVFTVDDDGIIAGNPFISGGTGSQEIVDLVFTDDGLLWAAGNTAYENNTMMCLIKLRL
ncbi:MAG: hypothetical protein RBS37_11300 [Bacteroidales bacterium]|jgi:hypothetical protein|nr:hypothetical protein [Bacteroidales bacterium]